MLHAYARHFLRCALFVPLIPLIAIGPNADVDEPLIDDRKKPNILFIAVDDLLRLRR
jgi:hypothetical protein